MYPKFQVATIGSKVRVECGSTSTSRWTKDGNSIRNLQRENDLVIYSADVEHTGVYSCRGTNKLGEYFSSKSEIIVASKLI